MLDINMINDEIKKLEECTCTNWNVCEKLATLYIIRDHYSSKTSIQKENTVTSGLKDKL